jgi:hypothetical protein
MSTPTNEREAFIGKHASALSPVEQQEIAKLHGAVKGTTGKVEAHNINGHIVFTGEDGSLRKDNAGNVVGISRDLIHQIYSPKDHNPAPGLLHSLSNTFADKHKDYTPNPYHDESKIAGQILKKQNRQGIDGSHAYDKNGLHMGTNFSNNPPEKPPVPKVPDHEKFLDKHKDLIKRIVKDRVNIDNPHVKQNIGKILGQILQADLGVNADAVHSLVHKNDANFSTLLGAVHSGLSKGAWQNYHRKLMGNDSIDAAHKAVFDSIIRRVTGGKTPSKEEFDNKVKTLSPENLKGSKLDKEKEKSGIGVVSPIANTLKALKGILPTFGGSKKQNIDVIPVEKTKVTKKPKLQHTVDLQHFKEKNPKEYQKYLNIAKDRGYDKNKTIAALHHTLVAKREALHNSVQDRLGKLGLNIKYSNKANPHKINTLLDHVLSTGKLNNKTPKDILNIARGLSRSGKQGIIGLMNHIQRNTQGILEPEKDLKLEGDKPKEEKSIFEKGELKLKDDAKNKTLIPEGDIGIQKVEDKKPAKDVPTIAQQVKTILGHDININTNNMAQAASLLLHHKDQKQAIDTARRHMEGQPEEHKKEIEKLIELRQDKDLGVTPEHRAIFNDVIKQINTSGSVSPETLKAYHSIGELPVAVKKGIIDRGVSNNKTGVENTAKADPLNFTKKEYKVGGKQNPDTKWETATESSNKAQPTLHEKHGDMLREKYGHTLSNNSKNIPANEEFNMALSQLGKVNSFKDLKQVYKLISNDVFGSVAPEHENEIKDILRKAVKRFPAPKSEITQKKPNEQDTSKVPFPENKEVNDPKGSSKGTEAIEAAKNAPQELPYFQKKDMDNLEKHLNPEKDKDKTAALNQALEAHAKKDPADLVRILLHKAPKAVKDVLEKSLQGEAGHSSRDFLQHFLKSYGQGKRTHAAYLETARDTHKGNKLVATLIPLMQKHLHPVLEKIKRI